MKNLFKLSTLMLALALSFTACNAEKKGEEIDTTLVDSSTIAPPNNVQVDTNTMDTNRVDSTASKVQ